MAILSDDAKWWVQITAILITLAIVAYRLWEKRKGRAQDGVTVNLRRWTSQRMSNVLRNDYSEWDMIKLEENSQHMRDAYKLLNKAGKHRCPWGATCPALKYGLATADGQIRDGMLTAEQHIKYAYNMTKLAIDRNKENRVKNKGSLNLAAKTYEDAVYTAKKGGEAARAGATKSARDTFSASTKDIGSLHHPTDDTRLIIF